MQFTRRHRCQTGFSAILGTGFSKQTDCGNCEASPTDSLLVVARPRPLDYGWQKAWAEQCGECILLIRAVARATRHSSPRADNRVPCPAFRWFSGRGEENSLADPVSFYGRNFISNMEFRFLPKLIEFSKVFPPIALREIYAKTRTNHRMVVYTVCRGNSWFVDLKRECCFDERKKGEYL